MIKSNAILEIKTTKIIKNYKSLQKIAKNSLVGATIKANAYGIGDEFVFKILYENGCRHFFLATTEEALKIRKKFSKGNVYVLNGLENNSFDFFNKHKIIPILVSIEELSKYIEGKFYNRKINIGVHIDTGINRLGISYKNLQTKIKRKIDIYLLISHFASADELTNSYSEKQNKKFKSTFNFFKSIKYKSIANSAAIIRDKRFHYEIVRPGISLYGGYENPKLKKISVIEPIIKLKAKILQVKYLDKNEYVGYNQTYKTKKRKKIAILGIGYGDGIFRILGNKGFVYFKKQKFKIIGRISMDSITIDISNSEYKLTTGKYMEIINSENDIEKIAKKCSTISREILTSISQRVKRIYL
tara:strand:+ start:111 stop:1184 length:1074 start_codon:yes stop_codon:yes gene_type:complete